MGSMLAFGTFVFGIGHRAVGAIHGVVVSDNAMCCWLEDLSQVGGRLLVLPPPPFPLPLIPWFYGKFFA